MKKTLLIVIILLLINVYAYGSTGYTNISNIALYNNNNLGSEVKDTLKMNSKVEILDNKDDMVYNIPTLKEVRNTRKLWVKKCYHV